MFDIGFSELVLIGVIALIVIGPERLPEVARTVGKYVGRMRRFVNKVRDDIESEISQEELREAIKRHADLDDIKKIINDSRYTIENEVEETRQHVVKARDEDPRGDFSQKELLTEQEEEFKNEDYGLTDHKDYGAEELHSESVEPQAATVKPAISETQASSADAHDQIDATGSAISEKQSTPSTEKHAETEMSELDKNRQDDRHDEKPGT